MLFVTVEVNFWIRRGGVDDLECIIKSVCFLKYVLWLAVEKNTVGSNLHIIIVVNNNIKILK